MEKLEEMSNSVGQEISCVIVLMLIDGLMILSGSLRRSLLTEQISSCYLAWNLSLQNRASQTTAKQNNTV